MSEQLVQVPAGKFYLGRRYDLASRQATDVNVFYDSKHLTTHAMCVGMTGSGKTGLCLALLEEAALNRIPAICIDPKGDLGNLLLTFPDLRPEDFAPWLDLERPRPDSDSDSTTPSSPSPEEKIAALWTKGLADWGQDPSRIRQFRENVDINIFTPGSRIGLPLTVLKSFDAPPASLLDDPDLYRERISGAASGLLSLLGISADPLSSREHILISNILDQAWRNGKHLAITDLIRLIQSPPIQRIGVIDLESFLPADKRIAFAMQLNNLLASPAFAGWLEGESLDIQKLLWCDDGKPRLSIISIAHLSDSERMFFVTLLLGELVSWMRSQSGTGQLRSIFYMDEVFGYFPPISNPPSKPPMLTLLKQARAFGLGIVLATQNPVDLDYKGLANIGTWLLGRLQTQRDKDRVLEGLEGASLQAGSRFDRNEMEKTLAALGNRVFLMNNVHLNEQIILQSRWVLSYLRGPLSREHIQSLMKDRRKTSTSEQASPSQNRASDTEKSSEPAGGGIKTHAARTTRPVVNADVVERFWVPSRVVAANGTAIYRPAVFAQVSLHFVHARSSTDEWTDFTLVAPCEHGTPEPLWESSNEVPPERFELNSSPDPGFVFAELPPELASSRAYARWSKELTDFLYRHKSLPIWYAPSLKRFARLGLDEVSSRIELKDIAEGMYASELDKIRAKYASRLSTAESKITAAEQRLALEKTQAKQSWLKTAGEVAISIFGALSDRKKISKTSLGKASSAARGVTRSQQEANDVRRAEELLSAALDDRTRILQERESEERRAKESYSVESLNLEESVVAPRKGDLRVKQLGLLWIPWQVDANGVATSLIRS